MPAAGLCNFDSQVVCVAGCFVGARYQITRTKKSAKTSGEPAREMGGREVFLPVASLLVLWGPLPNSAFS